MSVFDGLNRVGRCTRCEEYIYEIKSQYPLDHEYGGEARSLGRPLNICRVVTLVLMNGNQCDITMCISCIEQILNLPDIWRKLIRTWQLEQTDKYKIVNNSPTLTLKQKKIQTLQLAKMVYNVPVGVLCIRKPGDRND